MAEREGEPSLQTSLEEEWFLKDISFTSEPGAPSQRVKIITQNFNGLVIVRLCSLWRLRA